ncbi:MAG: heme ABC exporter ATP-binding protein CcmA [Robiginitomaculum sp.]|nr:heme ABC exporter ATP-binding protein CcmA [Robiginitomaculum sp.]
MTAATKTSSQLVVTDLAVSRGDNLLIDGLSFSMDAGDTLWVAGSNGIGKTSLLKCIAGLLRPDSGHVAWGEQDVHKYISSDTGYQGHHDGHKPNLTVLENLRFWQSVFASPIAPEDALEQVGLSAQINLRAKGLSAGQSRRLSLARLLLKQAKLWVLDEPAAAMDIKGRAVIHKLVGAHVAAGGCAIIASHTPPEKIGDNTRVLTLNGAANE